MIPIKFQTTMVSTCLWYLSSVQNPSLILLYCLVYKGSLYWIIITRDIWGIVESSIMINQQRFWTLLTRFNWEIYIYLPYIWAIWGINVGKSSSTMASSSNYIHMYICTYMKIKRYIYICIYICICIYELSSLFRNHILDWALVHLSYRHSMSVASGSSRSKPRLISASRCSRMRSPCPHALQAGWTGHL